MHCNEIRESIPAYVGEVVPTLRERRHLARCPECSNELTRYESLVAALGALEARTASPPAGLVRELQSIPARRSVRRRATLRARGMGGHLARNRGAYVGGAVAVAGTAATTLWRVRSRRLAAA